jgi:hypothetical protein
MADRLIHELNSNSNSTVWNNLKAIYIRTKEAFVEVASSHLFVTRHCCHHYTRSIRVINVFFHDHCSYASKQWPCCLYLSVPVQLRSKNDDDIDGC